MQASLDRSLCAAARAFRLGLEAEGSEYFQQCIDLLSQLLPRLNPEHLQRISGWLQQVLEAQERNDMIQMADLLEHEIRSLMVSLNMDR